MKIKTKRLNMFMENNECFWCKKVLKYSETTIEHMIPKSRGGTNNVSNLKLACRTCNSTRENAVYGNRKFHSFVASRREFMVKPRMELESILLTHK